MRGRKRVIVHGDLKGCNIHVEMWDSGPRAKLLDFGLSRVMSKRMKPLGGTVNWMAPEVILDRSKPPAPSADVFSFGRLVFMFVARQAPLAYMTCEQILMAVSARQVAPLNWPSDSAPLCTQFRPLAEECLKLDPACRPSMREVERRVAGWSFELDPSGSETLRLTSMAMPVGRGQDFDTSLLSVCSPLMPEQSSSMFTRMTTRRRAYMNARKGFMRGIHEVAMADTCLIETDRMSSKVSADALLVDNFGVMVSVILDGTPVAARVSRGDLKIDNKHPIPDQEELRSLMRVRHPNIIAFHGLNILPPHNDRLLLVLEWVEGVSLESFVMDSNPNSATRYRLLIDVLSALHYLHVLHLVHGDLNGRTVRVESRLSGPRAKLLDYGWSRVVLPSSLMYGTRSRKHFVKGQESTSDAAKVRRNALVWIAVEVLQGEKPTTSSDVFVFGRMTYLISTGRQPLDTVNIPTLEFATQQSMVLPLDWSGPSSLGDNAKVLSDKCFCANAMYRPDMADLLDDTQAWILCGMDWDQLDAAFMGPELASELPDYGGCSSSASSRFSKVLSPVVPSISVQGHMLKRMTSNRVVCGGCGSAVGNDSFHWRCNTCLITVCVDCVARGLPTCNLKAPLLDDSSSLSEGT